MHDTSTSNVLDDRFEQALAKLLLAERGEPVDPARVLGDCHDCGWP
jgi:hypothetical protein